jgi:hypothetical protein
MYCGFGKIYIKILCLQGFLQPLQELLVRCEAVYTPHWPISIKVVRPSVNVIRALMIGSNTVSVVVLHEAVELLA